MPERITNEYILTHLPFDTGWKERFLKRYPAMTPSQRSLTTEVLWDAWEAIIAVRAFELKQNRKLLDAYFNYTDAKLPPLPDNPRWAEDYAAEELDTHPKEELWDECSMLIVRNIQNVLRFTMGFLVDAIPNCV